MLRAQYGGRACNRGLTLLEVVVVVIVIGILFALLSLGVTDSRDVFRRNQCSTQINNLAKATIQYENAKKQYPGWIQQFGSFAGGIDPSNPDSGQSHPPHRKIGGWAVTLLPYLDAQPTYEIWTQDKYPIAGDSAYTVNAAPNLAIMQCPDATTLEGAFGRNSYISNNGRHIEIRELSSPDPFVRSMSRANGVFNSKFAAEAGGPILPVGDAVTADDLKDGLGNTVLFSENLQAMPWHLNMVSVTDSIGRLTVDPAAYPVDSRYVQGFVWHWEDPNEFGGAPPVSPVHRINGQLSNEDIFRTQMTTGNAHRVARPSSAHAGGVYMGFADGGSRFVQDSIDYRVYQALMTPHGAESDVPAPEFVLPAGGIQ